MLEWHPFAKRFPLIEGEEWEEFKESIRKTRGNRVPVIYRVLPDGTKQGIDGRNRERACDEVSIKCRMEEEILDDEEVIPFIIAANIRRRHMTPELRRIIIEELRGEGQSIRTIADTVGVSPATVARDIEKIEAVSHETVDTVTGKDGKLHPAKKPDAPIVAMVLCEFCQRRKNVGKPLIIDCPDCKVLRKGEKQEKKTQERRDAIADPLTEIYDDDENIVPPMLRPIFADSMLYLEAAASLDASARILESLEASPGYIMGNKKLNAGESKNVDKHVYSTTCRQGALKMKATRPAKIHENCLGEKCKECKGKGYLTATEAEAT